MAHVVKTPEHGVEVVGEELRRPQAQDGILKAVGDEQGAAELIPGDDGAPQIQVTGERPGERREARRVFRGHGVEADEAFGVLAEAHPPTHHHLGQPRGGHPGEGRRRQHPHRGHGQGRDQRRALERQARGEHRRDHPGEGVADDEAIAAQRLGGGGGGVEHVVQRRVLIGVVPVAGEIDRPRGEAPRGEDRLGARPHPAAQPEAVQQQDGRALGLTDGGDMNRALRGEERHVGSPERGAHTRRAPQRSQLSGV